MSRLQAVEKALGEARAEIGAMQRYMRKQHLRFARLYALLQAVEWSPGKRGPICPWCKSAKEHGHLDRCRYKIMTDMIGWPTTTPTCETCGSATIKDCTLTCEWGGEWNVEALRLAAGMGLWTCPHAAWKPMPATLDDEPIPF